MAKVLKVLKVLNFRGAGRSNIFKFIVRLFRSSVPNDPHLNRHNATPRPEGTRHPVLGPVR
jgi:hypothetical protein